MWSRLIAVLLVLALWPALGETVELVAHVIAHGDLAHASADSHDEGPLGANEHGCGGTFHLCSAGHVNVSSPPGVAVGVAVAPRVWSLPLSAPLGMRGCDVPAPPIRPPIA